jgi:adenine-specific DNA-methyltransferase
MPTLNWIGKDAVIDHHLKVPFHLLRDVPELACGEPGSGNLIVEGDNLVALKALLPYYAGQVKCIYIDPPYNTGNQKWMYNDNVNSPIIRAWLGELVGAEGDTLDRHDRWLCMMYPRLALLRDFLAPDGVMFVSIDDHSLPWLRILMDELFPHPQGKNRLSCMIWQTDGNSDNQAKIKDVHEYILAYSKRFEAFPLPPVIDPNISGTSKLYKPEIQNTIVKNGVKNPPTELRLIAGFPANFEEGVIPARTNKWPHYEHDLVVKDSKLIAPAVAWSGWSSNGLCEEFMATGFRDVMDSKGQSSRFVLTKTGAIEVIKTRSKDQSHVMSVIREVGSTQNTSNMLAEMGIKFSFPKPVGLIEYLISMVADKNALVLDSFAGSGTTGHAVLQLNKKDGGTRRFILAQIPYETDEQRLNGTSLARELTAKRVGTVIKGYTSAKGEIAQGLGNGFRFCQLESSLFGDNGKIRDNVTFTDLARHVFFTETGEPLPNDEVKSSPFLGAVRGVGVYLLFNGILGDKSANGGNILTRKILAELPAFDGHKVIYCAGCLLGKERLQAERITVRQTPYEIKVS